MSSLGSTISEIYRAVELVSVQSHEISAATNNMARRTEKQATALEETAAALEEISTISSQAQERTHDIQGLVHRSAIEALDSGQVVEEAIKAMNQIESSSKEMTEIISVIDEIAFQTNLLALNAGVEAASARLVTGEEVLNEVAKAGWNAPNRDRIVHVYISKNDRGIPGRGNIPWAETFRARRARGYDG